MDKRLQFIFINGRGSSGKDTQADILLNSVEGGIRISTGSIIRDAIQQEGEYARFHRLVQPYVEDMKRGELLPDNVIVGIVDEVVHDKTLDGYKTFIFTGFPRTIRQLNVIDELLLSQEDGTKADFICFHVSEETSRGRARIRRESYLKQGREIRNDDLPDVVENRLKVYRESIEPTLIKLAGEGRLTIISAESGIEKIRNVTGETFDIRYLNPERF